MLTINLYVKGCLYCTIGAFHMTIPAELSLLQNVRSRSSMPSYASSSLDLVVIMSCGLTLQICLIIALSFHCRHWRFGFVISQVSLAWSIALHTQELYMGSCVLKERWREERTGSSSMNFFQVVFTPVVVESSQPPTAESMSQVAKGSYHLQRVRSDGLPSVVCLPRGMQFTGTVRICNQGPLSMA